MRILFCKRVLFLIGLIISFSAHSFEYHQQMIVHNGAVISQLNQCGVHRVDNLSLSRDLSESLSAAEMVSQLGSAPELGFSGFLRGMTSSEPKINNGDIALFSPFGDGVISWVRNGDIFYSPTGRNLDGGDKTKLLWNIWHPTPKNLATYNGAVIIRGEGSAAKYNYLTVIDNALKSSKSIRRFTINGIAFIGAYKGGIYVQHNDGRVGFSTSLAALNNVFSMPIVAPAGSPRIQQIIDYKGGALFVASNGVYASQSAREVFSGSNVKKLLNGNPGITSVANYGGFENIESHTVTVDKYKNNNFVSRDTRVNKIKKDGSLGLLVSLKSGHIYFSADGNNLVGGGKTSVVAKPIDADAIKNAYTFYWQRAQGLDPWQVAPDVTTKVFLANSWDSVKLVNTDWSFGAKGIQYIATGLAFDFAGNPVTVDVYDKGWSGFQYKWRYRSTAEGIFSQTSKQNYFGDDGVLVRPSGCAVIVAATSEVLPNENFKPNSLISFGVGSNGVDWDFVVDASSACDLLISKTKEAVKKGVDPKGHAVTLFEILSGLAQRHIDKNNYVENYCVQNF